MVRMPRQLQVAPRWARSLGRLRIGAGAQPLAQELVPWRELERYF
jgi:hypothetical protein